VTVQVICYCNNKNLFYVTTGYTGTGLVTSTGLYVLWLHYILGRQGALWTWTELSTRVTFSNAPHGHAIKLYPPKTKQFKKQTGHKTYGQF